MTIEGGFFQEHVLYDYCKDCDLWYPNKHKCPPKAPPTPLWHKLYHMWRIAPKNSVKQRLLLNAWVADMGGKVVEVSSQPLADK